MPQEPEDTSGLERKAPKPRTLKEPEDTSRLGWILWRYAGAGKLTVAEIASAIGVPQSTISMIMHGAVKNGIRKPYTTTQKWAEDKNLLSVLSELSPQAWETPLPACKNRTMGAELAQRVSQLPKDSSDVHQTLVQAPKNKYGALDQGVQVIEWKKQVARELASRRNATGKTIKSFTFAADEVLRGKWQKIEEGNPNVREITYQKAITYALSQASPHPPETLVKLQAGPFAPQ